MKGVIKNLDKIVECQQTIGDAVREIFHRCENEPALEVISFSDGVILIGREDYAVVTRINVDNPKSWGLSPDVQGLHPYGTNLVYVFYETLKE